MPPGLRDHLLAGSGEPEHRTIAVAFVQFSGTDALLERSGPEALATALDLVIRNVQEATATHGVTFFETDINRDGGKIMLTAGAPRSLGHEEDRMMRAARMIADRIGELPLRIGINRGAVFSGDFGPAFRRTYSVKGDAINLAARVMGKAEPGQVLATRAVVERAQTLFEVEPLPPFLVKGKSQLIDALSIGPIAGARGDAFALTSIVGRHKELTLLGEALESARARRGRVVEIVGDPGIGKSRLAHDLRALAGDLTVVSAACEEYEASTPYVTIRLLLRDILGLPPSATPDQVHERLVRRVESNAPELIPWLPAARDRAERRDPRHRGDRAARTRASARPGSRR